MKKCFKCLETKELTFFHKHKGMSDGHLNKCSVCVVQDVAHWRSKNPDARKKEHAKIREQKGFLTREEYFDKRRKNAIGRKSSSIKYMHKRRMLVKETHLMEFDSFVMEEAIRLCVKREKVTGFKWHVDHIIPLLHKKVCGLHNANNLQVVPALWNMQKGNRNMNTFFV